MRKTIIWSTIFFIIMGIMQLAFWMPKAPIHRYKIEMYSASDSYPIWLISETKRIETGKSQRAAAAAAELAQGQAASTKASYTTGTASPRSNAQLEACIVRRESNGNYYPKDNPTHFGKYQFDKQTWVAAGGPAQDWGTASPAEQETVFRNKVNRDGYSAWTKYDGC